MDSHCSVGILNPTIIVYKVHRISLVDHHEATSAPPSEICSVCILQLQCRLSL